MCVQSHMLIIAGFAGLLVNTIVLRWLLRVAGERQVLCIGEQDHLIASPICRYLHGYAAKLCLCGAHPIRGRMSVLFCTKAESCGH